MSRPLSFAPIVIGSVAAVWLAFACSSSEKKNPGNPDASSTGGSTGTGGATGTGGSSGGTAGTGGADASTNDGGPQPTAYCAGLADGGLVDCGKYLVEHVDACADCHSPRLPTGQIDPTKILAGNAAFADLDPTDTTKGLVPTPNLTQLQSQGWTVAEIQDAIQNGNRSAARGGGLFPIMPYFVFHNMAALDAQAIAEFIYQLTPITNAVPARQPLPSPLDLMPLPIMPVAASSIPDTTLPSTNPNYASAVRGKYLAAQAGICMECHTERLPNSFALDMSKAFGGGESFQLPPPFTAPSVSLNITPGSNSAINGWTAQNIINLFDTGLDPANIPICPPMPAGPGQAFSGMKAADQLDIANYIKSLPPVTNPADGGTWPRCVPPAPPSDGGKLDASDSGG